MKREYREQAGRWSSEDAIGKRSDGRVPPSSIYRPARGVLWCEAEQTVVVLSIRDDKYYLFNRTVALMWSTITKGADEHALVASLAERYPHVGRDVLRFDVQGVLGDLANRGIISVGDDDVASDIVSDLFEDRSPSASRPTNPRRCSPRLSALISTLLLLRLSLKMLGLYRTLNFLSKVGSRASGNVAHGLLLETARKVSLAAPLVPLRAECLEQSLCLLWIARTMGAAAVLRFGVRLHPFTAHSWVELMGKPINDHAEHVNTFVPLGRREVRI